MVSKKRILFILHIPPPVHGSSIVGKQIKDSLRINESFKTEYVNLGTSTNVKDIGGWNLKKTLIYLNILTAILKKVIFNKYDLIYIAPTVSKSGFYKDFIAVFLIKFFHKKVVFHLHNKGVSKRKKNKVNNFLYKSFFKNIDVILLSKLLYHDISEFVPENKIHVCPNGIEIIPNLESLLMNKLKNKIPNILFLSNLIESKGVYILLEACKILKENRIDFNCLFVGGEGDITKKEFEVKVEEFNISDSVFYLGKRYGNEKHDVFLNADIFAFPTFYNNETFGLVNLEAMMYGLPLITTDEGGIPEVVENNKTGFIIEKENSKLLVEKIEILIKNESLRIQLGQNGRKKFLNEYTLAHFENNLSNILSRLS